MGIRETLNQNSGLAKGGAVAALVVAIAFTLYQMLGASGPPSNSHTLSYYSDDDGATYFVDGAGRLPPFEHDGKQAVAAYVYKCKDGKPFVGYLQRYTPDGIKTLQSPTPGNYVNPSEIEVSLPLKGSKGWVRQSNGAAPTIMDVKCPDGTMNYLEPLQP